MVEGRLFAIIDMLPRAKFITCTFYGMWGDDFYNKSQIFYFNFILFLLQLVFHAITAP